MQSFWFFKTTKLKGKNKFWNTISEKINYDYNYLGIEQSKRYVVKLSSSYLIRGKLVNVNEKKSRSAIRMKWTPIVDQVKLERLLGFYD